MIRNTVGLGLNLEKVSAEAYLGMINMPVGMTKFTAVPYRTVLVRRTKFSTGRILV